MLYRNSCYCNYNYNSPAVSTAWQTLYQDLCNTLLKPTQCCINLFLLRIYSIIVLWLIQDHFTCLWDISTRKRRCLIVYYTLSVQCLILTLNPYPNLIMLHSNPYYYLASTLPRFMQSFTKTSTLFIKLFT